MKVFIIDDCVSFVTRLQGLTKQGYATYTLQPRCYEDKWCSEDDFFWRTVHEQCWQNPATGGNSFALQNLLDYPGRGEKTIFLISTNLKLSSGSARQDQLGIVLLKHIRLTENLRDLRQAHVVLYSFQHPLDLLRRNPGNLILLSKGVTFLRLPEALEILTNAEQVRELTQERADITREYLSPFVQCDFRLPDAAHQFSNWWGIRQLVKAANADGHGDLDIPETVEKQIAKLNNKKALLLYGREEAARSARVVRIPEMTKRRHRVLHLDDEQLWSEVLRRIVSKEFPRIHFKAVNSIKQNIAEGHDTETWVKNTVLSIDGVAPDLVLLDLRLYGSREITTAVEKTSGALVAQMIRRLSPGTPTILMTASNKAWVFEEMMKLGVDAYWMKEGIGEHLPPSGSLENYRNLKRVVATALGKGYQFLRRVAQVVSSIKTTQTTWWENYTWDDRMHTTVQKDLVCSYLNSIVLLLREYLHLFQMEYGYTYAGQKAIVEASWLNALLMEATKVVELIHNFDSLGKDEQGTVFTNRNDNLGRYIYSRRSRLAAHAQGGVTQTSFNNMREAIAALLLWIQIEPTVRQIPWLYERPVRDLLSNNRDLLNRYEAISSGTGSP